MFKKISRSKSNPEESSTTKVSEHIPFGYSMSTICEFDDTKNKYDAYRDKDYMKMFCVFLKEYAMEIINFEEKKVMMPSTNKELALFANQEKAHLRNKV